MGQFTGPEEDVDAIRRVRQEIEDAVNAGDADAFARHLAHDVAQVPSGQGIHGRDEVVAAAAASYEAFDMEEYFAIDSIVVAGDLAIEHGTFDLTMSPTGGGEPLRMSGLPYAYAYERGQDGVWRVVRMSWETE